MSETVGEGIIRIRTDESGVDYNAAGASAGQGYSRGFAGSLKGIVAAIGGVIAAKKVLDFTKQSVAEAREAQKVGAATEQIIARTGHAANVTAKQVGDLSSKTSLATGIDDELIQSGQNLILTFKNVRNEGQGIDAIFDRTTRAAVDLSAAGFGSVTSQAKTLAKALNDPIKGMSALGRSGVTFTAAQQEQIKALAESGDLLGAQKIILAEVESQVGGVAAATATSGEKATTAWNNVKEAVGTQLLPVLDLVLDFFTTRIAPALIDFSSNIGKVGGVIDTVRDSIQSALGSDQADQAAGFFDRIRDAVTAFLPVVQGALAAALPIVVSFFTSLQTAAGDVLPVMADTFQNVVLPAVVAFASYVTTNVLPVVAQLADIFINQVIPTVADVAIFLYGTLYPALVGIAVTVATRLKPVFDQLVETFVTRILPTLSKLVDQVRNELLPALEPVIVKVVAIVGALLGFAAAVLGKVLPPLIRLAGFIISKVVPVLVTLVTFALKVVNVILSVGEAIIKGVVFFYRLQSAARDLVRDGIEAVVNAVSQLPGKVLALGGRLFNAGKAIMGRLLDGLRGAGGVVADIAGNVWDSVKGLLNSAIDKINAALEFTINLPGPDITINPPNIPHLARGTRSFAGGLALVGEEGPELVRLPTGAAVTPAAQTAAALRGGPHIEQVNITMTGTSPDEVMQALSYEVLLADRFGRWATA